MIRIFFTITITTTIITTKYPYTFSFFSYYTSHHLYKAFYSLSRSSCARVL
jgi:hypothetical protein